MLDIRFNVTPSGDYYLEKFTPETPLSSDDLTDDGYMSLDLKDFKWQPVRDVYGDIVVFPKEAVSASMGF